MKPLKVCFLDPETIDCNDLDWTELQNVGDFKACKADSDLWNEAQEASVLITNKVILGEDEFLKLTNLKMVCVAATGVNNIELASAKKHKIAVANVSGYSTPSVVEQTLLFLLALSHRFLEHLEASQKGDWSRSPHFTLLKFPYRELSGKTLGLVGYGHIGRKVAQIAKTLGMKVKVAALPERNYSDHKTARLPFKTVLAESDFLSLHCSLSDLTRHLIDRKALQTLKHGAYLLNLARGPIVEESAIFEALNSGELAGYAADVLAKEPPPMDHPFFEPSLRSKILLTPHVAWASVESRQRLINEIAKNILAFKNRKKRNRFI